MKYKVLVICGCKFTDKNKSYRQQQAILIKLFSKYTLDPYNKYNSLDVSSDDLEFITINNYDDADYIIKNDIVYKDSKKVNLNNYFDFIIYEHCPFSIIPEEHNVYSNMLKKNGIVIFYVKKDFEKVIDYFYNGFEIENYMFQHYKDNIYNNNHYYRKISGISFQKL